MFKVTVEAKTAAELRAKFVEFLAETQESTHVEHSGQAIKEVIDALRTGPVEAIKFVDAVNQDAPARLIPETSSEISLSAPVVPNSASGTRSPAPVTKIPSAAAMNDFGVDVKGFPWDERIHAVTQGKKADGTWRYKRGVEDSYIKQIETELQSRGSGQVVIPAEVPAFPVAPPALHVVHAAPVVVSPVPVAPPAPPPQPVVLSAHTLETFKTHFVTTMADLVRREKLDQPYIESLCKHYGVDMIHKTTDAQKEELFNQFVQYNLITKAE